ncbi:hypothetical protein CC78DRAFT_614577 [Lojkania enalia]|uniref:Uncharacterized protein n=1 Tax=Lojkania enalia TaxID=147567 RepID=A0A9P4KCJ8_9PLEO|nr:hypothetical protein CC78DRAFT_614577 [Didymosphaeria enalia]
MGGLEVDIKHLGFSISSKVFESNSPLAIMAFEDPSYCMRSGVADSREGACVDGAPLPREIGGSATGILLAGAFAKLVGSRTARDGMVRYEHSPSSADGSFRWQHLPCTTTPNTSRLLAGGANHHAGEYRPYERTARSEQGWPLGGAEAMQTMQAPHATKRWGRRSPEITMYYTQVPEYLQSSHTGQALLHARMPVSSTYKPAPPPATRDPQSEARLD